MILRGTKHRPKRASLVGQSLKTAGITVPENINMDFWSVNSIGRGPVITWNGPALGHIGNTSYSKLGRALEYASANDMSPLVHKAIIHEHIRSQALQAIHAAARVE